MLALPSQLKTRVKIQLRPCSVKRFKELINTPQKTIKATIIRNNISPSKQHKASQFSY
jgi:hypothetical protein